MWLVVRYEEHDITRQNFNKITVSIDYSVIAPIGTDDTNFRMSPIFPLVNNKKEIIDTTIYFFQFENAYRILGRINNKGSAKLKEAVFFSVGLASIILITNNEGLEKEFKKIIKETELANEIWEIKGSKVENISYNFKFPNINEPLKFEILKYEILPVTERAIIDEFVVSVKLLLLKLTAHMPSELFKMRSLIQQINNLIEELIFLNSFEGEIPTSLNPLTADDLKEKKLNRMIRHQNLDRIIQVNSALSYVSTQAFSGAIPILERRSLIRRNSLLGVGSAILALNRIARYIENSFSLISFHEIVNRYMAYAAPLKGLANLPLYDSNEWSEGSVSVFTPDSPKDIGYNKLPYFSGRLGFRETEYSIAAAMQSITSGASLQWSLMTVTHEMLHGHVRSIITSIFDGGSNLKKPEEQREFFYKEFRNKIYKRAQKETLITSIRTVILSYCCLTKTHGSLTSHTPGKSNFEFNVYDKEEIWNIFEKEHRNISEIFVHILDLHYFYASRVSSYIPLIWSSWLSVPHINGDIRQYVLRSLLSISSKLSGDPFRRFKTAIDRFKELLAQYQTDKLDNPTIVEVIKILDDIKHMNSDYFPAYNISLMIVDLVKNIFISDDIRAHLFNDPYISFQTDEADEHSFEQKFVYEMQEGFNDEEIKSPIAYMLDKMIKELNSNKEIVDLEYETTLEFLALNSFK